MTGAEPFLDEIFEALVDASPEDQESALRALGREHPTLAAEARALLRQSLPDDSPSPEALVPGATLGRYRLDERLGAGASASVWKAFDTHLQAWTALKLLSPRAGGLRNHLDAVMNEARAASQIISDHVVRIKGAGPLPGRTFYVEMQLCAEHQPRSDGSEELVVGRSLADTPRPTEREAVRFVAEAARGVEAAHRLGILHRDLKPANLLLLPVSRRVLVADFGLSVPALHRPPTVETPATASVTVDDPQRSRPIVGTPAYMAPEQAQGEAPSRASDLYALGATLYALLTGAPPYQPSGRHSPVGSLDVVEQVRQGPPPPLPGNPRLARIVARAMARHPRDRYPTAAALALDLQAWLDHRPTTVDGRDPILRARLALRRHRDVAVTSAILGSMVLASALAMVQLQQTRAQLEREVAEAFHRRDAAEDAAQAAEQVRVEAEQARTIAEAAQAEAAADARVAMEARNAATQGQTAAEERLADEIRAREDAQKERLLAETRTATAERRLRDALVVTVNLEGRLETAEARLAQETLARSQVEAELEEERRERQRAELARDEAERRLREEPAPEPLPVEPALPAPQ